MCVWVHVWVHVHAPSLVLVGGLGNVISCAGRRVERGVLFRLTLSKSHFQLWRTVATDLNQGFYFRTHTHTHVLTQKKEGEGWLQTLCAGIFALIQFFLKRFTGAVVRPAFTKIPRHSCLILCLCRSVCVHISKFCNFVLVTRSPMNFCTSVFLLVWTVGTLCRLLSNLRKQR